MAQLFCDLLFHCFSLTRTRVSTPCQARNALSNLYLQIQSRKAQAIGQDRAIGVDCGLHVLTVGGCQISSRQGLAQQNPVLLGRDPTHWLSFGV